jgi:alkylated DNA repair dioxygenase AlkB
MGRVSASPLQQSDLFASGPAGFVYRPELISPDEERALARQIAPLPFRPFEFGPYLGKRRVVSFGWRYDYGEQKLREAGETPEFLLPLREKAAALAGLEAGQLQQALVTEYEPGVQIGWHRDKPMFAEVIGISLLSPCVLRLRRKAGAGWERASQPLAPRSGYLLSGPARSEWEHSIPPVETLRYSVTFRRLREDWAEPRMRSRVTGR